MHVFSQLTKTGEPEDSSLCRCFPPPPSELCLTGARLPFGRTMTHTIYADYGRSKCYSPEDSC